MTEWLDLDKAVKAAIAARDLDEADRLLPALAQEAAQRGEPQLVCNTHFTTGLVRDAQGRLADAEEAFSSALALDEKLHGGDHTAVSDTLNSIGIVRTRRGDHEGALAAYRRAAEITRARRPFQLTLALCAVGARLLHLQRFDEALAIYDEAIAHGRTDAKTPHQDGARAFLGAGEVLRQSKRFPEAFAKLAMATQMARPNMWPKLADCVTRAWYTLGIVSRYALQNCSAQAAFAFWFAGQPGAPADVVRAASTELERLPEAALCTGDPAAFRLVYRDADGNVHVASAAHGLFHVLQPVEAELGDVVDVELDGFRAVRVSARP